MSLAKALPFFALAAGGFFWMHVLIFGSNSDVMVASSEAKKQYSEGVRPGSSVELFRLPLTLITSQLAVGVTFARACFGKRQTQLLLSYFGGSLAAPIVIILLEASRSSNPFLLTAFPTLYLLASQALGTGFIVPLYLGLHALLAPKRGKSLDDEKEARNLAAVVPSFLAGFVLPTLPALLHPHFADRMTYAQLDLINLVWQVYPVLILVVGFVFRSITGPSRKPSLTSRRSTASALVLAGLVSTGFYAYFLFSVYSEAPALAKKTDLASFLSTSSKSTLDVKTVVEAFGSVFKFGPTKVKTVNDLAHVFLSIDGLFTLVPLVVFAATYPKSGNVVQALVSSALLSPGTAAAWAYWKGQEERRLEAKKAVREKTK